MNFTISIMGLFILAIITHHIVAWAGSLLHEVGNQERDYSLFTFQHDRSQPMTVNILMNIFIPNVCMVFIYMIATMCKLEFVEKYLMIYVISYYFYRALLICVILGRKEMYSPVYEITMALVSMGLAYVLNTYFFVSVDNVFIGVKELKEELWLAIFVILYQFGKQVLDKRVSQNTVLTKGQISRYIIRKFNQFYERFNGLLDFNAKNCDMYIFMFSIMIFENYNRGPIKRFFERIKVRWGNSATVGIMQINSEMPLSDEESIIEFISWIEGKLEENNRFLDGDKIFELAWEHNNDNAYANSVAYIYECLFEYIDEVPKYRKVFCIRERESQIQEMENETTETTLFPKYNQLQCDNMETFINGISENIYINMECKDYTISETVVENSYVTWNEVYDGKELMLSNLKNMYFNGNGAEIVAQPRYAAVLALVNCHDIVISNMKLGHLPGSECAGTVLRLENCSNLHLSDCELYGCGVFGISSFNSSFSVENSKIHNCSYGAMELYDSNCRINDLEVSECNQTFRSIINVHNSNVVLSDSIIRDCSSEEYIIETYDSCFIQKRLDILNCKGDKGNYNE